MRDRRGSTTLPTADGQANDGGHYVRLHDGLTFCRREGAANATPIVLVHGATVPNWEFDALVPQLLAAGRQTLRFDLYGHGRSDHLRGPYSFDRFCRQLLEVVESARFREPPLVLGHSFGAALAADLAARRPEQLAGLVLVAPMLDFAASSAWSLLFRPRLLGTLAMRLIGVPGLVRRRRRRYVAIGQNQLADQFVEQAADPGFARAIASMFQHGTLGDKGACYAALRRVPIEILVISGDRDSVVPGVDVGRIRSMLPPHAHASLPAEHNLLLTHPVAVAETLVEWQSRRASRTSPTR